MSKEKSLLEVAAEETGSLLKTGGEEVGSFGMAVIEQIGAFFYSPSATKQPEPTNDHHCNCDQRK